jgi:hypothetical protein
MEFSSFDDVDEIEVPDDVIEQAEINQTEINQKLVDLGY